MLLSPADSVQLVCGGLGVRFGPVQQYVDRDHVLHARCGHGHSCDGVRRGRGTSLACGINTFSTAAGSTACSACPGNSNAAAGASECVCNTGFFSATGFTTSLACTGASYGHRRQIP
jgi:hypothetical protein